MSKEITIKNYDMFQAYQSHETLGKNMRILGDDFMQVSDGYHTFDELYDHRITLWIAFCKLYEEMKETSKWQTDNPPLNVVWRSKLHSDGSSFDGWFILGINQEKGKQITYHLPLNRWDETDFVHWTLEKAPEWDGHTSADVLERLKSL